MIAHKGLLVSITDEDTGHTYTLQVKPEQHALYVGVWTNSNPSSPMLPAPQHSTPKVYDSAVQFAHDMNLHGACQHD